MSGRRGLRIQGLVEDELSKYADIHYEESLAVRRQAARYIESCHLEDGGYFFACILPSSTLDTYFAIKSLCLLDMRPEQPLLFRDYFLNHVKADSRRSVRSIFLAAEVLEALGQPLDRLRRYASRLIALQNRAGGFGTVRNLYVEASSELEATYQAVRALRILQIEFERQDTAHFILNFLNPDGGFGRERHLTLATTFYAAKTLKLLGFDLGELAATEKYLRNRENEWRVHFIEDAFWLVRALTCFGEKLNISETIKRFVLACQRANGGFARATAIGIPTLEYTFYALSILREVGALH